MAIESLCACAIRVTPAVTESADDPRQRDAADALGCRSRCACVAASAVVRVCPLGCKAVAHRRLCRHDRQVAYKPRPPTALPNNDAGISRGITVGIPVGVSDVSSRVYDIFYSVCGGVSAHRRAAVRIRLGDARAGGADGELCEVLRKQTGKNVVADQNSHSGGADADDDAPVRRRTPCWGG